MASRADRPEPAPPEITVSGGPAATDRSPAPPRRGALPRALLALAALALLAAAVLDQRRAPPPAPCPEPCLEAGALVLGAALPVTGVLAPFGRAQQRGVERALDEVRADGGLEVAGLRRRVDLLVRDTRSQPDVAGQEALVLVRGPYELLGLIGPCSPPLAMVRVAETRLVPLVSGCQPLPALGPGPVRSTWQVAPAEVERASAVLRSLPTSPDARVGLFLSNDRSAVPWEDAAAGAGSAVLGTYRPQGRDWSSAVAQAARDGVQVVVAVTQPPEGIELWQELRRQGVRPRAAYASEAGLGSAWYSAVGREGDGTLTDLVHPLADGPATAAEVDDAVTVLSAELTRVLLDGLRRARARERPELRAALADATAQVAGTDVRFDRDQSSRLPVRLARWEDGLLRPFHP